ncbi:surfeit locus protein 6 [Cynocephalus volans]|uniref:surfeit locus protein 6 n=1 Tax=Cynocephalus volans TaxID=110931 RepID=UPI002FCA0170
MSSLLAKDAYLQSLARKICTQPGPEPPGRTWGKAQRGAWQARGWDRGGPPPPTARRGRAGKTQGSEAAGPPIKERKKTQKKLREQEEKAVEQKAKSLGENSAASGAKKPSKAKKPAAAKEEEASSSIEVPADGLAPGPDSFFALDVLRQRLHEKIQEARGQGSTTELSPATLEKRRRRKQERDRRKRKQQELRRKEKVAKAAEPAEAAADTGAPPREVACREPPQPQGLIFNKVEVGEESPAGRAQRRRQRRRQVKGHLPPLTGRNYRQLLERLEARHRRLEELRARDAGGARALEARMKWTDLLYKAEGVRVRDDAELLQQALRRRERQRAQRQRRWQGRTVRLLETMQQRQERRRRHLRGRREARAQRRLERARRKGRVLPQDLERAGLGH